MLLSPLIYVGSLKDSDVVSKMIGEVADKFPGMTEPLIVERDKYLAYTLSHSIGPVVVGVVGLG
jgi:pheromone shutdown protein TraB